MPVYGDLPSAVGSTGQPATALGPGDTLKLFNAEAPAAGVASIAIAISPIPGYGPIVFDVEFGAGYAAGDAIQVQGASVDNAAAYQNLGNAITAQQGYYADQGGFGFYRVLQSVRTGTETVTVTVRRT